MMTKKFYTINSDGDVEIRDLEREGKQFTYDKYINGEFDSYNYQWYENFNHFVHDDNGCDYERYGCVINEGDVVLDLGANIGVFAHRAEQRGASKVICFEPMSPTFDCLIKNIGPKTIAYKNAVGGKNGIETFTIHTSHTNLGGATTNNQDRLMNKHKEVHSEQVFVVDVNSIFEAFNNQIDFMKIDIEGGEVDVLNAITDENLVSLRCLSGEFHKTYDGFDVFQSEFVERMNKLGFDTFTLFHGSTNLRTITCWKKQ
jgi:FkbM family methyltransferase